MMTPSRRGRTKRVDPDELNRQSNEIIEMLENTETFRNKLANYLEERTRKNGFGTDFDYTIRPRRKAS